MYYDPKVLTYNSVGNLAGILWSDAPNAGPQNAGVRYEFTDYLVGVYHDHSGARISDLFPAAQNVNFKWTFVQGNWGQGAAGAIRFSRFDQHEPRSEGAVKFLGYFGSDPLALSKTSKTNCLSDAQ